MTPIGWEKVFLNNLPDKELIYKIYKELVKLIRKTPQNKQLCLKKMGRVFRDIFN